MAYEAHRETLKNYKRGANSIMIRWPMPMDLYAEIYIELDRASMRTLHYPRRSTAYNARMAGVADRLRRAAFDSQGVLQAMLGG